MHFGQIERYLASGMPVGEWCKLNKVARSTFYVWLSRYRCNSGHAATSDRESASSALKCGQTTEWISLTREELRGASAIVKAGSEARPAAPTPVTAPPAPSPRPAHVIVVSVNGADVSIPEGCDPSHISSVLSAVAKL